MSDRELLELAAKAAGYWNIRGAPCPWVGDTWNPLTRDGDALRLAVRLRMEVTVRPDHTWADIGSGVGIAKQPHGTDPYAATRRAIVCAAAEIGKANNA